MRAKTTGLLLAGLLVSPVILSTGVALGKEGFVVIPRGTSTNPSNPGFSPDTITVVLGVNSTVIWLNNDSAAHTVTPSTEPASGNWSVGSGNLDPGMTYQFTFTALGRYTYACAYHSFMHGTVIVKAGSTVPEFPASSLAVVLFLTVIAAVLALQRFKLRTPHLGQQ